MKVKSTIVIIAFAVSALCELQTVNAQTTWNLAGNNLTGTEKLGSLNNSPIKFITSNKTRMTLSGNRLGIGTTLPDATLHVFKGSAGTVTGFSDAPLVVENATNSYVNLLAPDANESGIFFGNPGSGSTDGGIIYNNSINPKGLQFRTNGNTIRMVLTSSGQLGIGNLSPSTAGLVVDNKVGSTNAVFGSNTTGVSIVSQNPNIGFNTFLNGGVWKNISNGFAGTVGVNAATGSLEFWSTATSQAVGTSTALINRMFITNTGFVGIGTPVPVARLDIRGNGSDGIFSFGFNGNGIFAQTSDNTRFNAGFFDGDVFTTAAFRTASDEKLKQNIRDLNSAMSIINNLHPKLYQFKKDGNYALMNLPQGDHYGLIAQDVEKVLPNLVKETKFDTHLAKHDSLTKSSPADVVDFKTLNYIELIPILIKAVQEQDSKIQEQDAKIETLTQLINKLQGSSINSDAQSKFEVNTANHASASLEQNIPNPLTNNTNIHYTIPAGTKAQLLITDNNGAAIRQIALNNSGKGVVNIETSTLSAGTYSYTLIIDGKKIETKKMVIVR